MELIFALVHVCAFVIACIAVVCAGALLVQFVEWMASKWE